MTFGLRLIKGLISSSSAQVRNGVQLVEQTGAALSEIIQHVAASETRSRRAWLAYKAYTLPLPESAAALT